MELELFASTIANKQNQNLSPILSKVQSLTSVVKMRLLPVVLVPRRDAGMPMLGSSLSSCLIGFMLSHLSSSTAQTM